MFTFLKNRLWLIFTISAAFSWAVWGVLTKSISNNLSQYSYQILFTLGMLLSLPFVIGKCKKSDFNLKGAIVGVLASFLAIIGNIFVYKSFMAGGQASIVLPLTNLYPIITIAFALIFFKEKLNIMNFVGIFIVIPAILMLSGQAEIFYYPSQFFNKLDFKPWLLFAFLAFILFGLFSASQKISTLFLPAEWSFVMFFFASLLISIGFIIGGLVSFSFPKNSFFVGTISGFFDGLGVLSIYSAYGAKGKATQVSSIASTLQQVFTIGLALLFLKEKLTIVEVFGLGLAVIGTRYILFEKKEI